LAGTPIRKFDRQFSLFWRHPICWVGKSKYFRNLQKTSKIFSFGMATTKIYSRLIEFAL
jgi:hypothetical protein